MYKNPDVSDAQKAKLDRKWVLVYRPIAEAIFYGTPVGSGTSKRNMRVGGANPKTFTQKVFAFLRQMTPADHCTALRVIQVITDVLLPRPSSDPVQRKAQKWDEYTIRRDICQALIQIEKKSESTAIDRIKHYDNEENEAFKGGDGSGWEEYVYYNASKPSDLTESDIKREATIESMEDRKNRRDNNVKKPKKVREKIAERELENDII